MDPLDPIIEQAAELRSQDLFSSEELETAENNTEMLDEDSSPVAEPGAEMNSEMSSGALESESMEVEPGCSDEQNGDKENTETLIEEGDTEDQATEEVKICPFPIAKLKRIMKTAIQEDTEVRMFNKDAVIIIGQATELFVAALAQEASKVTQLSKKKTITFQHLAACVKETETFSFLEGALLPDFDL